MPNAKRTRGTKTGSADAPDRDSAASGTARPGSGGAGASVGHEPGAVDMGIAGIAQDLATAEKRRRQNEASKRYKIRKRAEQYGRTETTNPGIITETVDRPAAETPTEDQAPEHFTIESASAPRKSYARKPKVDPNDVQVIQESLKLIINGLGTWYAGPSGEMQPHLEKQIVEPATRIIQRMQPDTVKAIQVLSDPVALGLGAIAHLSFLIALKRDQDGHRPARQPIPQSPPPPVETPMPTYPINTQSSNGHLPDLAPLSDSDAYNVRDSLI